MTEVVNEACFAVVDGIGPLERLLLVTNIAPLCQKFEGVILWLLFPGIRGGNKGNSPRAETLQAPVRSAQAIWALALNYARVKKLRIA